MIIFGHGIDITEVKRMSYNIKKNKGFVNRIFTQREIKECEKKHDKFSSFSKKFAAKEAFSKALGTGFRKNLSFKEIEIINDKLGKPYIKVSGKSLKLVNKIINKKNFMTFLSLSDEKKYSIASVIITK